MVIEDGDMVVLDFGGIKDGYGSDDHPAPSTSASDRRGARYRARAVRRAQQAYFEAVRPGVECQEIDRAARKVIADAGYGEYSPPNRARNRPTTHELPYMIEGDTQ